MKETKMYKRWKFYFLGLLILLATQSHAIAKQGIPISGRVFEGTGTDMALAGASVSEKGTANGTITDAQTGTALPGATVLLDGRPSAATDAR